MTQFRTQQWEQREQTLGDPAEQAFENWSTHYDLKFVRYGFNRPNLDMRSLPTEIRYTPDYVTEYGFVEVQGCGKDGELKFKHDKLEALKWWDRIYPVTFWFWSSTDCENKECGLDDILDRVVDHATGDYWIDGMFDGNKPYCTVRFDRLL